jgi:hypothetical protein
MTGKKPYNKHQYTAIRTTKVYKGAVSSLRDIFQISPKFQVKAFFGILSKMFYFPGMPPTNVLTAFEIAIAAKQTECDFRDS